MATLLPARLVPVDCARLQIGMYVAELDRSWLQTSLHGPGLLITQPEQLEELCRVCEYVYVDPLLSERELDEVFSTGLTSRIEALPPADRLAPLGRQRVELRALARAFELAVTDARRSAVLALPPLRAALRPVVASVTADSDTLPWLLATELRVGFLHARALGSAISMVLAGHSIGFDTELLEELALAGLLLDIGKVSVPITILAKKTPLNAHERGFVVRHVRRGLYMVRSTSGVSEPVENAVLGHHERLDGSGYPRGIHGTQLPLEARLAGIIDSYDAMLHDRRYAPAMAAHDALRVVNCLAGSKFDTAMVRSFLRAVGLYPTGSWLQLADGRLGVVRQQAAGEPTRPHVALVADSAGRRLASGTVLWQPIRRGDILRALPPGSLAIPRQQLDEALGAAARLAA